MSKKSDLNRLPLHLNNWHIYQEYRKRPSGELYVYRGRSFVWIQETRPLIYRIFCGVLAYLFPYLLGLGTRSIDKLKEKTRIELGRQDIVNTLSQSPAICADFKQMKSELKRLSENNNSLKDELSRRNQISLEDGALLDRIENSKEELKKLGALRVNHEKTLSKLRKEKGDLLELIPELEALVKKLQNELSPEGKDLHALHEQMAAIRVLLSECPELRDKIHKRKAWCTKEAKLLERLEELAYKKQEIYRTNETMMMMEQKIEGIIKKIQVKTKHHRRYSV